MVKKEKLSLTKKEIKFINNIISTFLAPKFVFVGLARTCYENMWGDKYFKLIIRYTQKDIKDFIEIPILDNNMFNKLELNKIYENYDLQELGL